MQLYRTRSLGSKYITNAFAAEAAKCRSPLWELTRSLNPLAEFSGSLQGSGNRGEKWRKRGKGKEGRDRSTGETPPPTKIISGYDIVVCRFRQANVVFFCRIVAEGKKLSTKRRCKFLEVSALLDHKVDEVLATIVRDSRARRRRMPANASSSADDDVQTDQKGCLHLASFSIFRKLFK